MSTVKSAIAANLSMADLIQASGKSLHRIAREADISLSHVSRIANQHRVPSLHVAAKLAAVLGVSISLLVQAANQPVRSRLRRLPASSTSRVKGKVGVAA